MYKMNKQIIVIIKVVISQSLNQFIAQLTWILSILF